MHKSAQVALSAMISSILSVPPAFAALPQADKGKRDRLEDAADRREDRRDRREDRRDRREDVRDKREDRRDAKHDGGPRDRIEDRIDKREDRRDKREDRADRRENRRDRREDRSRQAALIRRAYGSGLSQVSSFRPEASSQLNCSAWCSGLSAHT
jgi:hypothetical protein